MTVSQKISVENSENESVGETERGKGYFPVAQLSSLQTFPALATENNPQENGPTWTQRVDCNPRTHFHDHTDQTNTAHIKIYSKIYSNVIQIL